MPSSESDENVIAHPRREGYAAGPPSDGGDLDQAIGVLRSRVDEEFQISERLASKSRQTFGLTALLFAAIQTVAFSSFGAGQVVTAEKIALALLAAIAGALVINVAWTATFGEDLEEEIDLDPDAIVKWANEAGPADATYVRVRLVGKLAKIAKSRASTNKLRAAKFRTTLTATWWALSAIAVELVVALVARI